jgi:UDP-glucose 4-epimerase
MNLLKRLSSDKENHILAVGRNKESLSKIEHEGYFNVDVCAADFNDIDAYKKILDGQDFLFHLVSTTVPTTSNKNIPEEFRENVMNTAYLLEICVERKIKNIIFVSSGGTVYGKDYICPLKENLALRPINSYGIQKATIENLLYLYKYQFGLEYKVVRLANPYGPYQRPNGVQGVVTNFIYRALQNQDLCIYGDGSIVRDYIYIDDVITAILNIAFKQNNFDTYNVGNGVGTSINQLVEYIKEVVPTKSKVIYMDRRSVDVATNYLNIERYESVFGSIISTTLKEGIEKTAIFLKSQM